MPDPITDSGGSASAPSQTVATRERCPLWVMSRHRVTSRHVRYSPQSGHSSVRFACPLSAMCGRLLVGNGFLHVCSLGRCSHVFGLLARFA